MFTVTRVVVPSFAYPFAVAVTSADFRAVPPESYPKLA
jgi:hypothetical protein